MTNDSLVSSLTNALDEAFSKTICSQLWIGYGDVLFAGFGSAILPTPINEKQHPVPAYELQTFYADWFVERGRDEVGEDGSKQYQAAEAMSISVGVHVVGWNFGKSLIGLVVTFENDVVLRVTGWQPSELSTEERSTDAWVLRLPDGTHFAVSCDGGVSFDGEADMQNAADTKGAGA